MVRAAKAGVRMIFGTDSGSPAVPHGTVASELEFNVKLGVAADNHAALMSATREAAKMNRIDDKVGTLEKGKEADVIIVDGNPLEDLKALEKVDLVLLRGARPF